MPIFISICEECEHTEEVVITMKEDLPVCSKCGGKCKKGVGNFTFSLKGSWAKQGYK